MTEFPVWIIFVAIGAAMAGIGVMLAKRQIAQMNAAWQTAATVLHCSFATGSTGDGPTILGLVGERPAEVHSYVKRSGKSSSRYTRYTVEFPSIGIGLRLSRQAGIGQFLRILGAQDIEIGEPTFDEAFIVKATDARSAQVVLSPGRTMALNQLLALHPDAVITDDRIVINRLGAVRDPDIIVSTLRRLASTANLFADAAASSEMTALVERRLEGTLPSDYAAGAPLPDGIDARIAAGEALAAFGVLDVAQKVFETLAVEMPADRDVAGWSEQIGRERRESPPIEGPSAAPEVKPPPVPPSTRLEPRDDDTNRDPVEVATALFRENRLSFETAALFDERYVGTRVEWSGKLRKSTTVDHYRILGDGPFTKAIIDIAEVEHDLFGNKVVTAIVAFPPGSIDARQPGDDVSFSGTLVGIDALVRNLLVGGASLEP